MRASSAVVAFASARDADRRIAGVAAAARAVRGLADEGAGKVRLRVGGKAVLSRSTLDDVERLRGAAAVAVERGKGPLAHPPSSWEVVRATGKPGDGLVSRWLNRPASQRISLVLLKVPGARPIHATIANMLVALVMFAVLLFDGRTGLLLGGILFQAASILDGVDGEMARATYRSSGAGATLDSAVDMATNLLFLLGMTVNLASRDSGWIGWIGGWAFCLVTGGALLIARRARAGGGPLTFDLLKRRGGEDRSADLADLLVRAGTVVASRDCFAFLFMILIIAGLERTALSIFSALATIWILFVLSSLFAVRDAGFARRHRLNGMLDFALSGYVPGAPAPDVVAPARPISPATPACGLRHVSSSERGGWELFGRLLVWATRNNGVGGLSDTDPKG
jgi:CDP-L-myo-inositol myo-inositolphosphotransferase